MRGHLLRTYFHSDIRDTVSVSDGGTHGKRETDTGSAKIVDMQMIPYTFNNYGIIAIIFL